ncbi:MAG: alpha/beta hydrolase, partial [Acidimicrobiales bacterium]
SGNLRFTAMSWLDGYEPHEGEPGAERFLGYGANRVARATLLEHRSADRPWLICLHGFGMGRPGLDLRAFRALHLHRDLGLNVAFLTLPFHGRRNPGPSTAPPMPSADALDTVHGLTQAVWDVRQLLAHLRSRTSQPIGLMGLSLGGRVAATAASIDEPHAVLLLVPAIDLPGLAADAMRAEPDGSTEADLLVRATPLFAPVSPLQLTPKVPIERRFILAGTLDRFARPGGQAVALWRHWDQPQLHWYHGGHVSVFWVRGVQDAIDANLRTVGLADR